MRKRSGGKDEPPAFPRREKQRGQENRGSRLDDSDLRIMKAESQAQSGTQIGTKADQTDIRADNRVLREGSKYVPVFDGGGAKPQ